MFKKALAVKCFVVVLSYIVFIIKCSPNDVVYIDFALNEVNVRLIIKFTNDFMEVLLRFFYNKTFSVEMQKSCLVFMYVSVIFVYKFMV